MRKIDKIYLKYCYDLLHHGKQVGNTLELRNVKFTVPDITENIISVRNLSAAYLFGEWLWYFDGKNDVDFISAFGSMWKKLSDDGVTNNSAYGYIMRYKFGFDQIEKVIELLKKDPNSRRAVINLNTPNEDVIETKDEPCTIALDFLIRDNKLYCTGMMRSNDIWFGLPYDIAFFMELQKLIADVIGVEYGTYTHFAVSLHAYDKNLKQIQDVVENSVQRLIIFDKDKFWKNRIFVTKIIDSLCMGHYDSNYIKESLLTLAANNFGYKEMEIKDEDQNN